MNILRIYILQPISDTTTGGIPCAIGGGVGIVYTSCTKWRDSSVN